MKQLAFYLFFLINSYTVLSEGLEFPKDFDFGDVPVGNESQPFIRMLPYIIKNNTDDVWVIEHMILSKNFPDSISDKGNTIRFYPGHIIKYVNGPVKINPKSEFNITVAYLSYFFDDISKSGEKLSKTVAFFYHKEGEDILFEDSVKIFAKSIQNNEVIASGAYRNIRSCYAGMEKFSSIEAITIINNSINDIAVDSVLVEYTGSNLTPLGLYKIYDKNKAPEKSIKSMDYSRYHFIFNFDKFEKSIAKTTFFCSALNNNEIKYIVTDSLVFDVVEFNQVGLLNLYSRNYVDFVGKSQNSTLYVSSCTNADIYLDTIYCIPENINDEIQIINPKPYPIFVQNSEILYFILNFTAKKVGNKQGQICGKFRYPNGEEFSRCLDIAISVLAPSSILDLDNKTDNLTIYPIPATDILYVKRSNEQINENDRIKIVDLLGNIIFDDSFITNEKSISLNNLNNGIYFLQIQTNFSLYNKKFIINK